MPYSYPINLETTYTMQRYNFLLMVICWVAQWGSCQTAPVNDSQPTTATIKEPYYLVGQSLTPQLFTAPAGQDSMPKVITLVFPLDNNITSFLTMQTVNMSGDPNPGSMGNLTAFPTLGSYQPVEIDTDNITVSVVIVDPASGSSPPTGVDGDDQPLTAAQTAASSGASQNLLQSDISTYAKTQNLEKVIELSSRVDQVTKTVSTLEPNDGSLPTPAVGETVPIPNPTGPGVSVPAEGELPNASGL